MQVFVGANGIDPDLDSKYTTFAESLRAAGYRTGHYGKWHLGRAPYSPLEQGFEVDIPHTDAPGPLPNGFFHPFPVWPGHGKPGDNLEDLLCDDAVKFIHQHKDEPFFLNYWAFQDHSPWQAKDKQIEKYRAEADPENLQRNPVYAGMVETLDEAVGRLISALEQNFREMMDALARRDREFEKAGRYHGPTPLAGFGADWVFMNVQRRRLVSYEWYATQVLGYRFNIANNGSLRNDTPWLRSLQSLEYLEQFRSEGGRAQMVVPYYWMPPWSKASEYAENGHGILPETQPHSFAWTALHSARMALHEIPPVSAADHPEPPPATQGDPEL